MFDPLRRRRDRRKTEDFYRFTATLRQCLAAMTAASGPVVPPAPVGVARWRVAETPDERLKALMVRAIVFMEEQSIPFGLEIDAFEDEALHILGQVDGEPAAAGRLRWADGWARLERIAVRRAFRGRRLAHELIDFMLRLAEGRGYGRCCLHAQAHLCDLYRQHGFATRGEVFLEAGIPHLRMVRERPLP
jgi:predicted GNAT family N-acyltransferase